MIASALASLSSLVTGATVEWHCDPHAEAQRIYFANHSSHLDFVVIWSALPAHRRTDVRPVAGRDYWQQGAIRRYMAERVFRAVLIDRRNDGPPSADAARMAIERMASEMGQRRSLIVFPEGTRSPDAEIRAFKSGIYHLARLRPDAELIPVYLENLNRILPKGEMLPIPMLSRVVFGRCLRIHVDESKDGFLARARAALVALRPGS